MSRLKVVMSLVIVGLLAVASVEGAQSQPRGGRGGRGGGGGRMGRRFDPERMRERYMERIKENLEVTEEEWKVLEPRIAKVVTLSWQTRGGRGMFARRRRGGAEGAGEARELSNVEKATEQLQTTLENEEAKPKEIKSNLKALRKAREKAKQELAKAQKELREVLTLRQEARLVLSGMLD